MNPETLTPLLLVEEWLRERGYTKCQDATYHTPGKNYKIDHLERILVYNKELTIIIIRDKRIDINDADIKVGHYFWEPWRDKTYNIHDPDMFNKISEDFLL